MNKKLLFLPLISCALLASCTEEGANDKNNQTELPKQAQGKTVTFKAAPLSVETKSLSTKVDVIPNGNNDDLEWTDESVSFGFFDGSNIIFDEATVTPVFGGARMDVTIPEDPGTYSVYAISPSGSYFTDNRATTALTIDNQTQVGTDLSHLSPYVFLYSNPSTKLVVDENKNSTGDIPLSFDVLSSLIRFDIVNNSSTEVTLNSITIKFNGSQEHSALYKTVILNDLDGTFSYSTYNVVKASDLTLMLTDLSLQPTNDFAAYMAAFPTNGQGDLLIDLNITANGFTSPILYELKETQLLSGNRLYVQLDIESEQVPNYDGTKNMTIGNNTYKTYEYPTGENGAYQIWMVTNSIEGSDLPVPGDFGHYYRSNAASIACPNPWNVPTSSMIETLIRSCDETSFAIWTKYATQTAMSRGIDFPGIGETDYLNYNPYHTNNGFYYGTTTRLTTIGHGLTFDTRTNFYYPNDPSHQQTAQQVRCVLYK